MKKFKIKSHCKINLTLKVVNKLNNGYHNIKSLITFSDLHDVISVSKIKGREDSISFYGKFSKGIDRKKNTLTKVLQNLRKKKLLKKQAFRIDVKKNIPLGSGLGGGSSNAASLLNFLNLRMNLKLKKNEMYKTARNIGFDVPVSLEKQNTLLSGKKPEIIRINKKFRLNILIVYPNIVCSTKKIYSKNKKFTKKQYNSSFYIRDKKKLISFLKKENNDLEQIVTKIYPKIRKIIALIKSQNGCHFSRITGSGSACIGIFSNVKSAIFTQKLIKLKFPKYWSVVSKTI